MPRSKPFNLNEVESFSPEKNLEAAPSLEQTYMEAGLSREDASFLADFSDERRKKCVRKVSTNHAFDMKLLRPEFRLIGVSAPC